MTRTPAVAIAVSYTHLDVYKRQGLLCEGTTVIRNAERLRLKESDRIAAMEAELRACGGVLESEGGTITVHGLSLIHILYDALYREQGLRFEQSAAGLTVEGALTPG